MGRLYAARLDSNQKEIVDELRRDELVVHSTTNAGNGFPDIIVADPVGITVTGDAQAIANVLEYLTSSAIPGVNIHQGANLIIELKSGRTGDRKTKSKTKEKQEKFMREWKGPRAKCLSADEVYGFIGRARRGRKD